MRRDKKYSSGRRRQWILRGLALFLAALMVLGVLMSAFRGLFY